MVCRQTQASVEFVTTTLEYAPRMPPTIKTSLAMLSSQATKAMSDAADAVIGNVLLHGSNGMRTVPRSEGGLVAAVTLGGIDKIAAAWRPILSASQFALSTTGVFCHAAPMVRFSHPGILVQTCELADLLVVV